MTRVLTDAQIEALLAEGKPLPANWRARLNVKAKANQTFRQREFDLQGEGGNEFRSVLRSNELNRLDFSLVLKFVDVDGADYRLVRLNGRHPSQHTNKGEKLKKLPNATFRNRFHIHRATERYQVDGFEIDGYAEPTDNYDSFDSALEEFVKQVTLVIPDDDGLEGPKLWEGKEDKP
jgi:hypothetical protein